MKRISWTVVALMVTLAGILEADVPYRGPARYRTRFDPYAFGINQSGLITGYARYNPEAFGVNSNGLISEYYRYNPYAFGIHSSGLVWDYAGDWRGSRVVPLNLDAHQPCDRVTAKPCPPSTPQTKVSRSWIEPAMPPRVAYWTASYQRDPLKAVRNLLQKTLPGDYCINSVCRIDRELVTFDVLLPKQKLVIKIWNPKLIGYLEQHQDQRYYRIENYLKHWVERKVQWDTDGMRVRHIASNDTDHILTEVQNAITPANG